MRALWRDGREAGGLCYDTVGWGLRLDATDGDVGFADIAGILVLEALVLGESGSYEGFR